MTALIEDEKKGNDAVKDARLHAIGVRSAAKRAPTLGG